MSRDDEAFPGWSDDFNIGAFSEPSEQTRRDFSETLETLPFTGVTTTRSVRVDLASAEEGLSVRFTVAHNTLKEQRTGSYVRHTGYVGLEIVKDDYFIQQCMGAEPLDEESTGLITDTAGYFISLADQERADWLRQVHVSALLDREDLTSIRAEELVTEAPYPVISLTSRIISRKFADGSRLDGFVVGDSELLVPEAVSRDVLPGAVKLVLNDGNGKQYTYLRFATGTEVLHVADIRDRASDFNATLDEEDIGELGVYKPTETTLCDFTQALTQAISSEAAA